ncbi:STAS-like domain-containing protein [Parabacteroides chinchillae]
MCIIKLYDVIEGKDFPDAGNSLFDLIKKNMNSCDKITIDMEGVSSLPSMFLNVSIGRYIDEFGVDSLKKKISFVKITKAQAERITEYISKSNSKRSSVIIET